MTHEDGREQQCEGDKHLDAKPEGVDEVFEHISDTSKVPEKTIKDKSKGDGLSKAWLCSRDYVTELEVATLAFAVLNVFIWVLWWGKPLDVQDPIVVASGSADLPEFQPQVLRRLDRFAGLLGGPYDDYKPLLSNSVPSFWSVLRADNLDGKYTAIPAIAESIVGSVFRVGAIHCAAWNARFRSSDEEWTWRSCAVLVTVIPPLIVVLVSMGSRFDLKFSQPAGAVLIVIVFLSILVIVARLFLIVLPFTALRALPPGAFVDVD